MNVETILSVCLPCYNASAYIGECIDSILTQTFTNFELLIADDGSTDDTIQIIRSYTDSRIHLLECEHNYIATLNLLIKNTRGKYIVRMDADDIMMPDRLLIQYNWMEHHPDTDLLGGGMQFIGNATGCFVPELEVGGITLEKMLVHNLIAHPTVIMRKASLDKLTEYYEPDYIYAEDYKLWMNMIVHGLCLDNLPDLLIYYRVSDGQNSIRYRERQQLTVAKIQKEHGGVI